MLIERPEVGPHATVLGRSALPPSEAMARIAAFPLHDMFTGWRPFPAVTGVDDQDGPWDRVGASRLVRLADGGHVREAIVEWTPGSSFTNELTGFTDVFGRIVRGVRDEWSFSPDGDGSVVRWTWEFAPLPGRRRLMAGVVGPLWEHYMVRMIRASLPVIDAEAPRP